MRLSAPSLKQVPPTAWFGLVVVSLFCLMALFAPLIAPHSAMNSARMSAGIGAPWTAGQYQSASSSTSMPSTAASCGGRR